MKQTKMWNISFKNWNYMESETWVKTHKLFIFCKKSILNFYNFSFRLHKMVIPLAKIPLSLNNHFYLNKLQLREILLFLADRNRREFVKYPNTQFIFYSCLAEQ